MKITWEDFVKEVKKKYPKAEPEKVLNMVQTIYGKKFKESNYQVIRNSWTANAVALIYQKLEEEKSKKTKRSFATILSGVVKSNDYKNLYYFIQGNLGKRYEDLTEQKHIRNLRDTWASTPGKKLRKELEDHGGKYPIIARVWKER